MAYISQQDKKIIADNLKKVLHNSGLKYSLRIRNYSCIVMTIKSGPIDFIGDYNETVSEKKPNAVAHDYLSVNPYWYQEHFSDKVKSVLDKIITAIKSAGWYDDSDIQSDYFNTKYYFDINIGDWQKPYQVTK